MKKVNWGFIIILAFLLLSVLLGCSKYKEPAPFADGMYFEYRLGSIATTFNIHALDNGQFEIIEIRKRGILSDKRKELYIDTYGRVYESSFEPYEGIFSPLWIPVHKMDIGDTFDGGYTVARKEKWRKWEVLVVKDPHVQEERYFDLETGFWVGSFAKTATGRTGVEVLVNTNAGIPVEEIEE